MAQSKIPGWFVIILLIYLLVSALTFREVQAHPSFQDQSVEETSSECMGLDLVLVVDHSDSMYGYQENPATDPKGVRVESVRYLINQLFANRLIFCPEAVHRVAVIGFGAKATVQLPVSLIDIAPDSSIDLWQQARDRLTDQVTLPPEGLGQTNFAEAFALAQQIISQMRPLTDTVPRKKAIIVLTDGNVCVDDCGKDNSTFNPHQYMRETLLPGISSIFQPWQLPYTPDSHTYIWLVAINNGPNYLEIPPNEVERDKRTIGDYWRELTRSRGGDVFSLGQDAKTIPETYLLILNQLLGRGKAKEVPCNEPVYVDPYVQKAIFSFFKNSEDVQVKITFEEEQYTFTNGEVINGPAHLIDDYVAFGPAETYIINRPGPGQWRVETDCKAVLIYEQIFVAQVEPPFIGTLPLVDKEPYYDPLNPIYLEYRLRGGDNQPFNEDTRFPLTIRATIIQPQDKSTYGTLELKPIGDGKYSSKVTNQPLPQGQEGRYKIKLFVSTLSANPNNPEPLIIYDNELGFYDVRPITWFDFKVLSPDEGQSFNLVNYHNGKPFPSVLDVVVQLTGADGTTSILPDGVLFKPETAFTAKLTTPAGRVEKVVLQPDPVIPGEFRGKLRNSAADTINDPPGDYMITVEFAGKDYNNNDYSPRRLTTEVTMTGMEVKPVDFRITSPTANQIVPWHRAGLDCLRAVVEPISLQIELIDGKGNFLDANSVLAVQPSQVFSAVVISPNNEESDSFTIEDLITPQGLKFQGNAEALFKNAGVYRIEVKMPTNKVLRTGYTLVADLHTVEFKRSDTYTSNPLVCRVTGGFSGLVLLVIAGIMTYIFTGGPSGTLFLEGRDRTTEHARLGLTFWKRTNRFKKELGYHGKVIIEVTNEPALAGKNRILVKFESPKKAPPEQQLSFQDYLDKGGGRVPVTTDIYARYE